MWIVSFWRSRNVYFPTPGEGETYTNTLYSLAHFAPSSDNTASSQTATPQSVYLVFETRLFPRKPLSSMTSPDNVAYTILLAPASADRSDDALVRAKPTISRKCISHLSKAWEHPRFTRLNPRILCIDDRSALARTRH